MIPTDCKQLLKMGILQAYADGKTVEYLQDDVWIEGECLSFNREPHEYRIKPEHQFKEGDLVRTGYVEGVKL